MQFIIVVSIVFGVGVEFMYLCGDLEVLIFNVIVVGLGVEFELDGELDGVCFWFICGNKMYNVVIIGIFFWVICVEANEIDGWLEVIDINGLVVFVYFNVFGCD